MQFRKKCEYCIKDKLIKRELLIKHIILLQQSLMIPIFIFLIIQNNRFIKNKMKQHRLLYYKDMIQKDGV